MNIQVETQFNVGETVHMEWLDGRIDVEIVSLKVFHNGKELSVLYDVDIGSEIYTDISVVYFKQRFCSPS